MATTLTKYKNGWLVQKTKRKNVHSASGIYIPKGDNLVVYVEDSKPYDVERIIYTLEEGWKLAEEIKRKDFEAKAKLHEEHTKQAKKQGLKMKEETTTFYGHQLGYTQRGAYGAFAIYRFQQGKCIEITPDY